MEWPNEIDETILNDIVDFKKRISNSSIKEIVDINSAYNSILVSYDYTINNFYDAFERLKEVYYNKLEKNNPVSRLWKIPVCYDAEFATDMDSYSSHIHMKKDAIIKLHTTLIYTVYFIGFLPGFLYLGGLDSKLHLARRSTPNLNIKKGSVAIGGKQTGIYPQDSPGGWHIIGNSPIDFFDIKKDTPCFATAGDRVQFISVDAPSYGQIKTLVDAGVYQLESEVLHD